MLHFILYVARATVIISHHDYIVKLLHIYVAITFGWLAVYYTTKYT